MISVIIPAYDAQEYLPEAIRSVLAQSFPDYELLVVDDGSTDRTASIAVATAGGDSRFRLLSKSNGGLADARNYGVANARGEWIAFLDSDDSLYPGALSLMYHVACKSGCDIVTAGFHRAYRYDVADGKYDSAFKVLSAVEAVGRTLYQRPGMYPSACAKLYRKSLFDRVGFTSGIWYEDLDFFYRAYLLAGKVAVTRSVVYFYRRNQSSFLSVFSSERLDVLAVTERMERYISGHCPELLPAARDRRLCANFNMLSLMLISPEPQRYADEIRKCRDVIKSYRWHSLFNPRVRIKNKAGALASFFSDNVFAMLSRIVYRPVSGKRVVTVDESEFICLCSRLASEVKASGYTPDIIVGIYQGGAYVAAAMSGIMDRIPVEYVRLSRPSSRWKSKMRSMLRFLPYTVLDRLRLLESGILSMRRHPVKDDVELPSQLLARSGCNILVVDDAVDSGATLSAVVSAVKRELPMSQCRSAVLTVTTSAPLVRPDYMLYDDNTLIRFPWSTDMKK